MRQQNLLTTKQMHHKFKLEETKSNVFKKNLIFKNLQFECFLNYSYQQSIAQTCYQSHHTFQ